MHKKKISPLLVLEMRFQLRAESARRPVAMSKPAQVTSHLPQPQPQPPVPPTTALVKSIRLSNQTGGAITTTVTMMDSSNSNLEIELYKDSLADGAEAEVLTQPIVLEQADAIKLTGGVKILVSLMEITV